MKIRRNVGGAAILLVAFFVAGTSTVIAEESAAEKAVDPSAILTQIAFLFNNTIPKGGDEPVGETLLFQPVLPMSKKNIFRPALPLIGSGGANRESGIGDLFLLDLVINSTKSGNRWGLGLAASVPTATNDALGTEKWELGPVGLYMYKGIPKTLVGILGYNLTSFAGKGSRQDVNKFFFQPIFVRHTKWGYWGWTDQIGTIDWENSNNFSIPLGLRFGKVFQGSPTTLINLAVGFYYTVNENSGDVYGIKFTGTFVKPTWLNH